MGKTKLGGNGINIPDNR